MKFKGVILILLFLQCLTTSFQCSDCGRKDMLLGKNKSWVPLRGTSQLAFADNSGAVTNFTVHGLDTTVLNMTECGDTYKYQYITNTLYLNTAKTDSIYFSVFSTSVLGGRAVSNGTYSFSMHDVLGRAKEGKSVKSFSRLTVNNKTFNNVVLISKNDYASDTLDSVMLADNIGFIGFKYSGKIYALQ